MAKKDDEQRNADTPSRVYRSSDVHKRRVDRKGNPKPASRAASEGVRGGKVVAPEDGRDVEDGATDRNDSDVVLKPRFGKRSEAQRQSDERWFAAMRGSEAGYPTRPMNLPEVQQAEGASIADELAGEVAVEVEQDAASASALEAPASDMKEATQADAQGQQADQDQQEGEAVSDEQPAEKESGKPSAAKAAQEAKARRAAQAAKAFGKRLKPGSSKRDSAKQPHSKKLRIVVIVAAIVVVLACVTGLAFAWNRWYRFDDHADLQGTWYVVGTTVPVEIDATSIKLTDDVTYQYEINTREKTLSYTFGPMSGQGRYWFSDDRLNLVITDGDQYTAAGTAFEDLLRAFSDSFDRVTGSDLRLPEGEGIIALSRTPDAAALAKEQAEAEAKKKQEEEEAKQAEQEAAAEADAAEEYYYEEEYYEEGPSEEVPAEDSSAEGAAGEEIAAEGSSEG